MSVILHTIILCTIKKEKNPSNYSVTQYFLIFVILGNIKVFLYEVQ